MRKFYYLTLIAILLAGCHVQQISTSLIYNKTTIPPHIEHRIDSLINDAISKHAMPGCRVLVAKDGYVTLDKAYGYLSYDSTQRVQQSTLYDLASVTKIAASSLLMMKLYEDSLINLDTPLSQLFDSIADNGATLRDALAHQAGFKPGVYFRTAEPTLWKSFGTESYNIADAQQIIRNRILHQPMMERGKYLYSDMGFFLYPEFARKYYNMDFDEFLNRKFYQPLGISPLFNPIEKAPDASIAPTENDTLWRRRIVCGTVHDEGAALMGGVSGHAGLFATANDIAVIMQMLLNGGEYGGIHFLKPETIQLFTSQAFDGNRRGLIFDKPPLDTAINGTPSKLSSRRSFGHTGFTGPLVWADPENNLLLIFLCNSTFPNRETMLTKLNVRTQLHDILYQLY